MEQLTTDKTAHQLWIDQMHARLEPVLYPPHIDKHRLAFMTSRTTMRERADKAKQITSHQETTRLQVMVSGIIQLLEACDRRRLELKEEYRATPWILMLKCLRLKRQDQDQRMLQEAYKKAILILTNTPPPVAVPEPEERRPPETSLRNACQHCEGTGYSRPAQAMAGLASTICNHCKGSGTEPETASA